MEKMVSIEESKENNKGEITLDVKVNTSEVDVLIEKLKEANLLADELSSKESSKESKYLQPFFQFENEVVIKPLENKERQVKRMTEQQKKLEELCKPVHEYLKQNYDPYVQITITNEHIKVKRDIMSIPVKEDK